MCGGPAPDHHGRPSWIQMELLASPHFAARRVDRSGEGVSVRRFAPSTSLSTSLLAWVGGLYSANWLRVALLRTPPLSFLFDCASSNLRHTLPSIIAPTFASSSAFRLRLRQFHNPSDLFKGRAKMRQCVSQSFPPRISGRSPCKVVQIQSLTE